MKFSENRPLAWAALVVSVIVSFTVFGGYGLRDEMLSVEQSFYSGGGDAYFSMDSYVSRRADYANKLAAMGLAEFGAEDEDSVALSKAAQDAREAESVNDKLDADEREGYLTDKLYARLDADGIGDSTRRDARLLYADFTDAAGKMRGDEYSARAKKFNGLLMAFPANVMSGIYGIHVMEVFE